MLLPASMRAFWDRYLVDVKIYEFKIGKDARRI